MPKHRPTDELKDIVYIDHYFNDWDADTRNLSFAQEGIYSRLRSLYFKNANKNNGRIDNDFELLCFRIGCHTDDERADLAWVLKDKFKIVNKSYRQKAWDEHIKNIRFKMRKSDNAGENRNAKSNGSNGGGVTPSNIDGNAKIYDNSNGLVMTGAERTEKSRKLKSLKNKGVQADKSMTLDEIRGLYDAHFNKNNSACNATPAPPSNDDSNADGNGSNAQNAENNPLNYNPFPITQELQEKNECVNSETLHAPTHTNFSQKLKTIGEWQAPSVDIINGLLSGAGFGRTLSQDEYGQIFTKFKNYNVSRELQGNFLATEQVRIDKLVDWIKREKPIFNTPTPADDDFGGVWTDNSNDKLPEPKPNTFNVGGKWVDCFDGYNGMECIAILKEYRLTGETSLEAYERIKRAGVANCQKPQTASPEFVSHILSKYNRPQQAGQVAR